MTAFDPLPGASPTFLDRQRECELLDGLLRGVRAGRGGVVVVRGEAGIGKTALVRWPLDERVRERVLGEAKDNPLALRELPRDGSLVELAGGFGPPGPLPLVDRIEERFRRQIADLPAGTRRLLRVAAACPVGDPARVWRAGRRLGIPAEAAAPAVEAGLIEFATWVRFRHPLVRSAAYHSASLSEWHEAHRALAEASTRSTSSPGSTSTLANSPWRRGCSTRTA